MRPWQRYLFLLALALLTWFGGPAADLVRNLSLPALAFLFGMLLFGSLSQRALLALVRFLLSVPFFAMVTIYVPHGQVYPALVSFAFGLALCFGPYFPIRTRRWLYGVVLVCGALTTLLCSGDPMFFKLVHTVALEWAVPFWVFWAWTKNGSSRLDRTLIECQRQALAGIAWLNGKDLRPGAFAPRPDRFQRELEAFFDIRLNPDSRRVLQEISEKHTRSVLAIKFSYAFAIAAGEFRRAGSIIRKAHENGFEDQIGYLPLAYALHAAGDLAWENARDMAYAKGELQRGPFEELRDPFLIWRRDPEFGRMETYLVPNSQFVPPQIIAL